MADVTDMAFRRIIAKYSKVSGGHPFVMWTEFVSADGLVKALEAGKRKLLKGLAYTESERPIVAQLFTGNRDVMRIAAKLVAELGFDGLDINMGCPDRSIEKSGAGAALIKDSKKARDIIRAAREGISDAGSNIPVSVKTRIGYNRNEIETWIRDVLEEKPDVLTVHLRTRKEMSLVPAHWEEMQKILKLRDEISPETLIFGNGDVKDCVEALSRVAETGCDGVMLGRAIFGRPSLFSNSRELENKNESVAQKKILEILLEHSELYENLLGDTKSFAIMKKHFKAYVSGWEGAAPLRQKLMLAENSVDLKQTIDEYIGNCG